MQLIQAYVKSNVRNEEKDVQVNALVHIFVGSLVNAVYVFAGGQRSHPVGVPDRVLLDLHRLQRGFGQRLEIPLPLLQVGRRY